MGRTTIGITTYGRNADNHMTLPAEYIDAVRRGGGVPLLLPPGQPQPEVWLSSIDGLILAGGGDLDPATYGGTPHPSIYMLDAERDESELGLARTITRWPRPTLAICRGMQVLNVALGGDLHEHLPAVVGDTVAHRLPPRSPVPHEVQISGDGTLADIVGASPFACASWHHQAIRTVASDLRVVGHAPDGVIEAVEHTTHPWLVGVQWHPELTAAQDPIQQRLFDALVSAAADPARRHPPELD